MNDTTTEAGAIEMMARHIITRPIFRVLFEGHELAVGSHGLRSLIPLPE